MQKIKTIIVLFFFNLIFIQQLSAIDISDWSYEKPFHHVENCGVLFLPKFDPLF